MTPFILVAEIFEELSISSTKILVFLFYQPRKMTAGCEPELYKEGREGIKASMVDIDSVLPTFSHPGLIIGLPCHSLSAFVGT